MFFHTSSDWNLALYGKSKPQWFLWWVVLVSLKHVLYSYRLLLIHLLD